MERPRLLGIVDLEATIRRDPAGLDRTTFLLASTPSVERLAYVPEISSDNLRRRILLGHINRPDSGSSANVKDAVRGEQRRNVQFPSQEAEHDLVMEVEAVLLLLVCGHQVLVLAKVRVVAASVFKDILLDRGAQAHSARVVAWEGLVEGGTGRIVSM